MDGASIGRAGGDGDEGKGDLFVFAEANGGDGFGFGIPEESEVLLHAGPVPAAVGDVIEFGVLDFADEAGGVGEVVFGRWGGEVEAAFEGEFHPADAGEEVKPRKEEPESDAEDSGADGAAGEVEGEVGGDEEGKGAEFAEEESVARSQGDAYDKAGQNDEEFAHK